MAISRGHIARSSLLVALLILSAQDAPPGQRPAADIWWTSSGWKIARDQPVPQSAGETLPIRSARNEAEAAQLVIHPNAPLRGFRAQAQALSGPDGAAISADNVEVLRVRYVTVSRATDRSGKAGPWPDPLPRFTEPIDLDVGMNQPLWVRVKVPRDARPGLYNGAILLTAEGYKAEAKLNVEVYDFDLPERMTCVTAFGFQPHEVWRYQKIEDPADRRAVLDKYLANFSEHHISPYNPAPMDDIKVTWPDRKTFVPSIDFSDWDAAMAKGIDRYRFNSFRLSIPGMGGGTFHSRVEPELLGFKEDTPEYRMAFKNYCRILQEHLREKGWLDEAFVYWFDEPDPKDYEFVMNGFKKLKEAAPDINRMLTEQVEKGLIGGPNIWCPISNRYKRSAAAAGDKFWWYVCTGPQSPYCTLFIDHPAVELRVWLWQTWQRGISGILIWQTNYWNSNVAYPDPAHPQNPYDDPMGWKSGYGTPKGTKLPWGNGDGRFIYPPESAANGSPTAPVLDGPVESIRWEMLRDGIEDYEYLAILRDLLAQKGDRLTPERNAAYQTLLEVPPSITKDMTTFTKDPAPIEARRHAVAKAIESISKL